MGARKRTDRWLWIVGILGLVLYFVFSWKDMFAAQEWKMISREEAVELAKQSWTEAGVNVEQMKSSAVMQSAESVDGYLGKEDLRDSFAASAPQEAPITYWHVTFYPQELSERDIRYETNHDLVTGKVVGYERVEPTDVIISKEEALQKAQAALIKLGVDLKALAGVVEEDLFDLEGEFEFESLSQTGVRLLSSGSEYRFSWKAKEFEVGELSLYYHVTVEGEHASLVESSYYVPASFDTWHSKQKLYAGILTGVSALFSFLLLVCAFVFLFLIKQKRPYWSSLWLSLIVTAFFAFSNINQWPILEAQTLQGGGGLFGVMIFGAIAIAVVVFISILFGAGNYVLTLTGGMLTREVDHNLWMSRKDPEWSERMRLATKRGFLLAFAWLGFQGVFYFVGETFFGVWYENDLSMSPANMWVPALFPLMAWLAGIQEEITYRLFGVTFLKRYVKYAFIATLLPAMIWALGHTLYPIYPIYTRFIELTIFGVIIGYCFLRYGLETVIMAHVVFDTILMCIPLLLSGEAVQVASGIFFLILPLLVGYGLSLIKRRKEQFDFV